jgi:hypothetical protein
MRLFRSCYSYGQPDADGNSYGVAHTDAHAYGGHEAR